MAQHPLDQVAQEVGDLVPTNDGSPDGGRYAFVNARRVSLRQTASDPPAPDLERDLGPIETASTTASSVPSERATAKMEALVQPGEVLEVELSEQAVRMLLGMNAVPCNCSCCAELMDDIFTTAYDGRWVVRRPTIDISTSSVQALPPETLVHITEALAISRCPFTGGRLSEGKTSWIDPSVGWSRRSKAPDTAPLCCSWMEQAALGGHVTFPQPGSLTLYPSFVLEHSPLPMPFFHCPRCGMEMCILIAQRRAFFKQS